MLLIQSSLLARLYPASHPSLLGCLLISLNVGLLIHIHLSLVYECWLYLIGVDQASKLIVELLILGRMHIEIVDLSIHIISMYSGRIACAHHLVIQVFTIELAIDALFTLANK
jgi:hypothetical protein